MSKFPKVLFVRRIIATENRNIIRKSSSRASFNLSEPAIEAYLKRIMFEHEDLYMKAKRTPEQSRRYFQIKPVVNVLQHRISLLDNITSLKQLIKTKYSRNEDDAEMKRMMKEETKIYEKRMEDIDRELQMTLLEPNLMEGAVLLEVKAETGGKAAMKFAHKLFKMYKSYANYKDWETSVVSYEKSDKKGIIKASMFIEGLGAYEFMKLETGIHCEKKATKEDAQDIQTSTVTVTVLPKPTEEELRVPENDIIEEKLSNDNFVRIIHAPTGLVVECQENESKTENKHVAIQKLRTLLLHLEKQDKICTANEGQEVRTYNYLQDQVIEHRKGGGTVQNLQRFMQGSEKLEQVQENLLREQTCQTLMEEINQCAADSVKN